MPNDKYDYHHALGRAIELAAEALPDGWRITVELERGSGSVRLYNPDGDEVEEDFGGGDYFYEEVEAAITHARTTDTRTAGDGEDQR